MTQKTEGAFQAGLEEELAGLKDQNLYRQLRTLEPVDGTHALLGGRRVLLFCANDYLGLAWDPKVIEAARQAALRHGAGAGASRLISGTSALHTQLEIELAAYKKTAKALVFTAGYLANLGVLTALAGPKDLIVMDKLCHASLVDGARLSGARLRVFPHRRYERCEEILKNASGFRRRILVSETVFSMDGDLADLHELVRLKEKYEAALVIDDAHGTGVLGPTGAGGGEEAGLEAKIDIMTGTLSKGLGVLGGFAAGSAPAMDYLINNARPFIFATALPPSLCAAALEAIKWLREAPELRRRLWENVRTLHAGLRAAGFPMPELSSPILPVGVGSEKAALSLSEALLGEGFLVPAVRYPAVARGKARLRLTVSALHTSDDLQALLGALQRKGRNFL